MRILRHKKLGAVVYEQVLTPEQDRERQESIERYARTHPEGARGTLGDCCGPAVPGKEIDRSAPV